MEDKEFSRLLEKYQKNQLSGREPELVERWLEASRKDEDLTWTEEYKIAEGPKLMAELHKREKDNSKTPPGFPHR